MSLFSFRRAFCSTPLPVPQQIPSSRLRNLIIIAHIDSGKSTLSDRLLQLTGTVPESQLAQRAQFLDSNPIERERRITIKARAARMRWRDHRITLIDCPGHHDFSRQVSQAARAVEAALLIVDATRGVQAQTLSGVDVALECGLDILPVINKVDLPTANVDAVRTELEEVIGMDGEDAVLTSAKTGWGVNALLDQIVERLSPPQGHEKEPLQALVFDSYYDLYQGVVLFVRIVNGTVRKGDRVIGMAGDAREYLVEKVGFLMPDEVECDVLRPGDIGFMTAGIKSTGDVPVGDTVTHCGDTAASSALPGYEDSKPVVFCGLFPNDMGEFNALRTALQKLQLQDASIVFEPDKSAALGTGFRCGFLGLLHMSVTQQRLEKEFGLNLFASAPSVCYLIQAEEEEGWRQVSNPALIPEGKVKIKEPYACVELICNDEHVGCLMELAQSRRGELEDQRYVGQNRVKLVYSLPMAELVTDFHDAVKSRTSGFGSMHYEISEMKQNKLKRMDIYIAGELVDGMSAVVHEDRAVSEGRFLVKRLREVIPRQMFKVSIQAVIGSKVIASEHIAAFRKDVTAKCYGGDASRKKKLLKKQAEGKKRMKTVGRVSVPQEAFLAIMSRNDQEP